MRGETIRVNEDNSIEVLGETTELNQYCYFCDFSETKPHQHHIIRRSDGGKDIPNNILPLCANHHELIHRRIYVLAFNPKQKRYYLVHRETRKVIPPAMRQMNYPRELPKSSINHSNNISIKGDLDSKGVISIIDFEKVRSKKQEKRLKNLPKGV